MPESLNFDVTIRNLGPLPVKLCIQIGVLLFSFVIDLPLLVDFGPESLDKADVAIDTTLVVLVHSTLVLVESSEVLFHVEELVLEGPVVSLSLAQFCCFLH